MSAYMPQTQNTDYSRAHMTLSGKPTRRLNGDEPLLRFKEAKKVLGEIYTDLGDHVDELKSVYKGISTDSTDVIPKDQEEEIAILKESIQTITETFSRDNMKVVFFGRTSNGKSTTINAMLHNKVLPQGMGHTTCCFLQVQGCREGDGYMILGDDPSRIDIKELGKMGHAMSSENSEVPEMGQDSLLRIYHPIGDGDSNENRLLQNDVVLLDSPGVDLSPEFDSWIDKHCLDADVFVLVLNAESTLTQAEKNFFYRVAKKLSKPNIFILNNRWDASASEDDVEEVKKQHQNRFRQFLVNELEVCTEKEVNNRIYFVSSREVLEARLKEKGLTQKAYQASGSRERLLEFENFEKNFEQCISRSAILSKFEAHKRRAFEIIQRMRENVDQAQRRVNDQKIKYEDDLKAASQVFNDCRKNFSLFETAYLEQTEHLRAEVHLKVSADFAEEILRLEAIIDRFNQPFVDSAEGIREYKESLSIFTNNSVNADLEARCTGGLMSRIWNLENDMFHYVKKILSEPYQHKLEEVWRYRAPFKFSICVDAPALIQDFHEDLEFRFTFGLSSIIRRIVAYRSGQPVTAIQTNLLTPLKLHKTGNGDEAADQAYLAAEENAVMTQMVLSSAAYLANGSLGVMVVCGVVYKAVGWRVIAVGAAAYGGLYALERLRWNSSAKEQHFKEQFRSHLAARMKQVAAAHISHCEIQAVREMNQVFDGLKTTVGGVHREMKDDLDKSKRKIDVVDATVKALATIKGKTALLLCNLEQFASAYLRTDSPSP
ncbi:unnamed protein product [Auanema sp. JU1783]|nr:unnamed protein product [Auanema sp. JU1783]